MDSESLDGCGLANLWKFVKQAGPVNRWWLCSFI